MTVDLQTTQGFRHEALLYRGEADFVVRASGFIREGVEQGEPVLVVVSGKKIEMLREDLGRDASRVTFADMADVGRNPARIIPAWRAFVDEQCTHVNRFRGIGEPISTERSPSALVECQRHEALLNLAFDDGPEWWLLCPYDTEALSQDVIDEAYRTHPFVENALVGPSEALYRAPAQTGLPFAAPLSPPPAHVDMFLSDRNGLDAVRRWIRAHATSFGLTDQRVVDLVLASSEVATNSLLYGGGLAELRLWSEGDDLICEVSDAGGVSQAMAGRVRPTPGQTSGYGLWIANQLCDLVQIRAFEGGSVVRLHMSR